MAMFDLADYINVIGQHAVGEQKTVSVHCLFRSLGIDYEDERRYKRHEAIVEAIEAREKEMLNKLSLTDLRALDVDDEIPDTPETPVPGEQVKQEGGSEGGEDDSGGDMGGDMGGPPPPPPPPPA